MKSIQKNPLLVETDIFGEYFGKGRLPIMLKDHIKEKFLKISELKEEISEAKNKAVCPHCQSYIAKNSVYCSVCGEKLK